MQQVNQKEKQVEPHVGKQSIENYVSNYILKTQANGTDTSEKSTGKRKSHPLGYGGTNSSKR